MEQLESFPLKLLICNLNRKFAFQQITFDYDTAR
jgi:hypothetical protein